LGAGHIVYERTGLRMKPNLKAYREIVREKLLPLYYTRDRV
jgi:hypothetical protein